MTSSKVEVSGGGAVSAAAARWIRMFRTPRPPRPPSAMTEREFIAYVVGLMRAGGWAKVSMAAVMGRLGTDVMGVGADGRRWLVRCHHDASRLQPLDVHRFADTVRELRRGDVAVLATAGEVPEPVRLAAASSSTTVVDGAGLAWWARVQRTDR